MESPEQAETVCLLTNSAFHPIFESLCFVLAAPLPRGQRGDLRMKVTELDHTQAARWVWDSLWSPRRHARINILDVALFDEGTITQRAVTSAGMRWLFTAKDGRVMKKSSHNSSLGALKQTLLSRVFLRGGGSATNSSEGLNAQRELPTVGTAEGNAASGRVFATALMCSGDNIPLDEAAWTALVVRNGGREGGAQAVTALAPAGGDLTRRPSRRGDCPPQRFICEYKLKPYSKGPAASTGAEIGGMGGVATTLTKPTHASLTTYVVVSRDLLRDSSSNLGEPQQYQNGENAAFDEVVDAQARSDERLVSRAKATNHEVEDNLRRIVQWVQEVRRVHVLSMVASFSVIPPEASGGSRAPGVWLERSSHVRMVSNGVRDTVAPGEVNSSALIAELRWSQTVQPQQSSGRQETKAPTRSPSENLDAGGAGHERRRPPGSDPPRKDHRDSDPESTEAGALTAVTETRVDDERVTASAAVEDDFSVSSAPSPSTAKHSAAKSLEKEQLSTAEMFVVAADAVLSACEAPPTGSSLPQRVAEGVAVGPPTTQHQTTAVRQQLHRVRLSAIGTQCGLKSAAVSYSAEGLPLSREKCGGDFCSCDEFGIVAGGESSRLSEHPPFEEDDASQGNLGGSRGSIIRQNSSSRAEEPSAAGAELDWTDVGACDNVNGAGLLQLASKQHQGTSTPGGRTPAEAWHDPQMLFSTTFKSIGLARAEAENGRDAHWGEVLRKQWRKGRPRKTAGGLGNLSPALVYREVSVCRTCYDTYQRLDKLRERAERTVAGEAGLVRGSSSSPSLPTSLSKRQQGMLVSNIDVTNATTEISASTLRAEVARMLEDVDARATKPSITEAGIPWRSRLRKSKNKATADPAPTRSSQALLVGKLARPKRHYSAEEGHIASSVQREGSATVRPPSLDKRRVKSQGDIPDFVDCDGRGKHGRHHSRRASASLQPCSVLPPLKHGHSHRRDSAGGSWQQQQRTARPSGAPATTDVPEHARSATATQRILPDGAPRRGAWPPLEDDEGAAAEGYCGTDMGGFRGVGGNGNGGGGGAGRGGCGSGRSKETIRAIEAMLEEGGGESYLPERASDLPEASTILGLLGSRLCAQGKMRGAAKRRKRGASVNGGGDRGSGNKGDGDGISDTGRETGLSLEGRPEDQSSPVSSKDPANKPGERPEGRSPEGTPKGDRGGKGRCRVGERFLHPWQRALEANKRAVITGREEHEAALARERQRRREALGAAAASKDCRKAGRRVAARLGRQRRHRRRGTSSRTKVRRDKPDTERAPNGAYAGEEHAGVHHEGCTGSAQDGLGEASYASDEAGDLDLEADGDDENDDRCLRHVRDALGWARKTFGALLKRLQDRGVTVEQVTAVVGSGGGSGSGGGGGGGGQEESKHWEVVRVVNKLRRRLAAFDDECVSFRMEAAAATAVAVTSGVATAGGESSARLIRSKAESSCEQFEIEFCHLIDELTATAKDHPSHPDLQLRPRGVEIYNSSHATAEVASSRPAKSNGAFQPDRTASEFSLRVHGSTHTSRASCFGLCPRCSVLPVSRRCLDCDGDHADRDRCSSCFVREHRDALRRTHRFLRISGGGGGRGGHRKRVMGGGGDDAAGKAAEAVPNTVQSPGIERDWMGETAPSRDAQPGSSAAAPRCSSCGDLAASRRCRDCRVDTCAACHFLAHRSPSRQSHVTELVGTTAVSVQEALYLRNRDSQPVPWAAAMERGGAADGHGCVSRETGETACELRGGARGAPFGRDAAKSLVQVRRTIIDAPVVRPRSSEASASVWRLPGDAGGGKSGGASSDDDAGDSNAMKMSSGDEDLVGMKEKGDGSAGIVETPEDIPVAGESVSIVGYVGIGSSGDDGARLGQVPECDDNCRRGRWRGVDGDEVLEGGKGSRISEEQSLREIIPEKCGGRGAVATALFGGDATTQGGETQLSKSWEHTAIHREGQWREGGRFNGVRAALGGLEEIEEEQEEGEQGEEEEKDEEMGPSILSSAEEDSDEDEGMMWAPVNIARVGIDSSEGEASVGTSPPPSSPGKSSQTQSAEQDDAVVGSTGTIKEAGPSDGLPPGDTAPNDRTLAPDEAIKDAESHGCRSSSPPGRRETAPPPGVGGAGAAGVHEIDRPQRYEDAEENWRLHLIPRAGTPRSESETRDREVVAGLDGSDES